MDNTQSTATQTQAYFGAALIYEKAMVGRNDDGKKHDGETIKQAADQLRSALKSYLSNKEIYIRLVTAISDYPLPYEMLKTLKVEEFYNGDIVQALSRADDGTLISFCQWNQQYQTELQKSHIPEVQKYRQEWIDKLKFAIGRQHLPAKMDRLEQSLNQVSLVFDDPLKIFGRDMGGFYDSANKQVVIGAGYKDNALKAIVWHALLHSLSSQTTSNSSNNTSSGQPDAAISGYVGNDWLLEGATEQITQILLEPAGEKINFQKLNAEEFYEFRGGVYRGERAKLYEFLVALGRNDAQKLAGQNNQAFAGKDSVVNFIKAYFENNDSAAGPSLWQQIIDAYKRVNPNFS